MTTKLDLSTEPYAGTIEGIVTKLGMFGIAGIILLILVVLGLIYMTIFKTTAFSILTFLGLILIAVIIASLTIKSAVEREFSIEKVAIGTGIALLMFFIAPYLANNVSQLHSFASGSTFSITSTPQTTTTNVDLTGLSTLIGILGALSSTVSLFVLTPIRYIETDLNAHKKYILSSMIGILLIAGMILMLYSAPQIVEVIKPYLLGIGLIIGIAILTYAIWKMG